MLVRSRMVRASAALALVPLVVFSNPQTASASTVGPWVQVDVTVPLPVLGEGYGGNGTCAFNVQHADTSVNVGTGGYCIGLPDVTPGSTQPMEAGSAIIITASGQFRDGGGECSGDTTVTLGQHDKNGTIRVAGSIPSTSFNISGTLLGNDCDIARVCVTVDNGGTPACQNVTMPSPEPVEEPSGACPYGTPRLMNPQVVLNGEGSSTYRWRVEYDVVMTGELPPGRKWTAQSYSLRTGTWRSWPSVLDRFAGVLKIRTQDEIPLPKTSPKPGLGDFGPQGFQFSTPIRLNSAGVEVPSSDMGGVDWNTMNNGTAADNFAAAFAAPSTTGTGYSIPPAHNNYYGGWSDPGTCRFWVGPKVLDVAGHEGDEPSSEIDVPPTTPEPPEEPVVEPPPTIEPPEGFNWLEAIWAVLKGILSVITGLAQAIISGIGNLLENLFVPSVDSWEVGDVKQQLENKPPFSVGLELGEQAQAVGQAFGAAGACGVLADFGDPGLQIDCTQGPGIGSLYSAVQVILIGLTGLYMFRIVASVFQDGS